MLDILFTQLRDWKNIAKVHPRGQDLTEYGLLVALIAIVVVLAIVFFGENLSELWSSLGDEVASLLS